MLCVCRMHINLTAAAAGPVLAEGHTLFSVDGDKALAICACMSGKHTSSRHAYAQHVVPFVAGVTYRDWHAS